MIPITHTITFLIIMNPSLLALKRPFQFEYNLKILKVINEHQY